MSYGPLCRISNHFIIAAPVIAEPLAKLFSVLLRHGFLPAQLINCVLVPIPKPGKPPLPQTPTDLLPWPLPSVKS